MAGESSVEQVERWVGEHWSPELTLAQWWDLLWDAGYAFPSWPVGLGGLAATAAEARIVTGALASAGTIAAPVGNGPNMGAPTLIEHGTDDQLRRFVEPLGRGRTQWCQLFSEPGAGSDLASLSTRAEVDGDELVVSGQKVWSSKADVSEWGMLLCRTDLDVPKHQGITFVMLDMRQPGVEVRPLVQMNGAAEFSEVFLTEARVQLADVIGGVGAGWSVARTTLAHERASSAAAPGRGAVLVEAGSIPGKLDRPVGELVDAWRAAGGAKRRQAPLLSSRQILELARAAGGVGGGATPDLPQHDEPATSTGRPPPWALPARRPPPAITRQVRRSLRATAGRTRRPRGAAPSTRPRESIRRCGRASRSCRSTSRTRSTSTS